MTETNTQAQATAAQPLATPRQGEPCESCAAPLASDQRYCLNCGCRRGGPRVDYRHYMAIAAGEPSPSPGEPQTAVGEEEKEPAKRERDFAPLAAVGGIAVLGLMLLVGVLIGKGNDDTTTPTPTKVVVPAVGGESTTASSKSGNGGEGSTKKAAKGGGSSGAGAKKVNGGLTGGNAGAGDTVEASSGELESLESESGASYEEQSKKLPNKIATPGKPPPIDTSKPPGGGEGGGEVIK
jgi:hypothetical protein